MSYKTKKLHEKKVTRHSLGSCLDKFLVKILDYKQNEGSEMLNWTCFRVVQDIRDVRSQKNGLLVGILHQTWNVSLERYLYEEFKIVRVFSVSLEQFYV